MSSVCGKLDFKDADFDISTSSPPTHSSQAGSDESQESDGDETGYINQTENEGSVTKDLGKSTLGSLPPMSSDDEDNANITPVVLIPAIKGSREKHGLKLKKSSVSWADDVYDPPPSIASHTRNKKQQQQQQQQKSKSKDNHHKKTGKKGQKNSSSRSGKDKKQSPRKHSREKFDWVTQLPIVAASS